MGLHCQDTAQLPTKEPIDPETQVKPEHAANKRFASISGTEKSCGCRIYCRLVITGLSMFKSQTLRNVCKCL